MLLFPLTPVVTPPLDMLNSSCSRRVALGSSGKEMIAQISTGGPEVVLRCGVQFLFMINCFLLYLLFLSDSIAQTPQCDCTESCCVNDSSLSPDIVFH